MPFLLVLFMLVSGFVIPASLERRGSVGGFWISRVFRLYPLYWFSLALLFGVYLIAPPLTAFDPRSGWSWLANATMFQDVLRVPHANPVFWTLTIEMAFYLLCSGLFALDLLGRSCGVAWLGLAALGLLGTVLPLVLGIRFPAGYAFLLLSAQFGAVFYHVAEGRTSWRQLAPLLAALLVVSAGVAYTNFAFLSRAEGRFSFLSVFTAWVAAFVVFLVLLGLRPRIPRLLLGLGTISYSVYLLHPLVLRLLPGHLPPTLFLTLAFGITLAVASMTYVFIERPFVRLGTFLSRHADAPARVVTVPAVRAAA